jgi:hypothetical protein
MMSATDKLLNSVQRIKTKDIIPGHLPNCSCPGCQPGFQEAFERDCAKAMSKATVTREDEQGQSKRRLPIDAKLAASLQAVLKR